MPLLTKRVLLLARKEVTYGLDPTPTNVLNGFIHADLEITPEIDALTRPSVLGTSLLAEVGGKRRIKLNFTTELMSSGTRGVAAKGISPLWQIAGMSETIATTTSVTYAFLNNTYPSCTIYVYMDGLLFKVSGCVGNWDITGKAGEIAMVKWDMDGLYLTPIDTAFPSSFTPDAVIPVACKNLTMAFDSLAGVIREFTLKSGNKITERGNIAGTTHGIAGFQITECAPEGSITLEAGLLATKNFYTKLEADTVNVLSIALGATAGNIITFTGSQCRMRNLPYKNDSGIITNPIPFQLAATTAGNNQLSIVHT